MSKKNKNENYNYKERLTEIFENTIKSNIFLDDDIESIDYFGAICKATAQNRLYKILNCNLSMFNYNYNGQHSILIFFGIPTSSSDSENKEGGKHISQKVMEIVKIIENCFITVDYMNLKDVKEDKFSYLTIIKKVEKDKNE